MGGDRVVTLQQDWLMALLKRCVEMLNELEPEPSSGASARNESAPE
jgi:hypothetical protein